MVSHTNTSTSGEKEPPHHAEQILNEHGVNAVMMSPNAETTHKAKPELMKLASFISAHFDEFIKDKELQQQKRANQKSKI